ncbi:hypothetical protein ACIQ7D_05995 [Streptomyces sp. NPDC096310]|uniref:hypothetical protein n=1 Tax=Streptomyces sp. NPDC096310 TaxID=3366082 RepID=UPI003829E40C
MYRLASDVTCLAAFAGLARDCEIMYRVWDHLMLTSSQRENHAEAAAGAEVMKRSSVARRDPR